MSRDPNVSSTPPPAQPGRHGSGNEQPLAAGPPKPPGKPAPPGATPPVAASAVTFTRLAAAWWAVIVGSLFLIVLLVFIAQNTESISIRFFGWEWHAPLGVAFLAAAVCGALITVLIGAARMIQLRRAATKNLRAR